MAYCESGLNTWATIEDLYDRYGVEFVDKLSVRTVKDASTGKYYIDETDEAKEKVLGLALEDAKAFILNKLSCLYSNVDLLQEYCFSGLKQWHIRLTIETLRLGGDCAGCGCIGDLDKYLSCGNICSDDGQCLSSNSTFFAVAPAHFPCECCSDNCGCC